MMRGNLPPLISNATSVLPLLPLEIVLRKLLANAMAARPSFGARLGEYAGRCFAIDPVDCPFVFLITPGTDHLDFRVLRRDAAAEHDARIAAPLLVLLGMIDGSYDGDALFFSRDLTIDGDTEAVLALRNALENADLDPATVLGLSARFKAPVDNAARFVFGHLRRMLDAPEESGPNRGTA
jgi:O2-independent ubiquinone biosynthesis accessory factor UbiT